MQKARLRLAHRRALGPLISGFLSEAVRIRRHARHVMMVMTMMAMNPHLSLKV
jgi:hypothetical protein